MQTIPKQVRRIQLQPREQIVEVPILYCISSSVCPGTFHGDVLVHACVCEYNDAVIHMPVSHVWAFLAAPLGNGSETSHTKGVELCLSSLIFSALCSAASLRVIRRQVGLRLAWSSCSHGAGEREDGSPCGCQKCSIGFREHHGRCCDRSEEGHAATEMRTLARKLATNSWTG